MLKELLPNAVLSIGFVGHRDIDPDEATRASLEHTIADVLGRLERALPAAVAREAQYFAPASPLIRAVSRCAQGAELLGVKVAARCGFETSLIIPFPWNEYRHDFSAATAPLAAEQLGKADAVLELPGQRGEGPRAYERSLDLILANIDVLVAVWDGQRARGRAGTGDVVQSAVEKRIPIIVVDPACSAPPAILAQAHFGDFTTAASDLARRPLPGDLADFVHAIVAPPQRELERRALADLIDEPAQPVTRRFEYALLLRSLVGRPPARRLPAPASDAQALLPSPSTSAFAASNQEGIAWLDHVRKIIDDHAMAYGDAFRSSTVSEYLIVVLGVWLSGVIGLLIPALSSVSISVQLLANAVVLADTHFRGKRRWQERWLDYRVLAEQLRWLRFRCSFGLGAARVSLGRPRSSWTHWYVERVAHAIGSPKGCIDAPLVGAALSRLLDVEIPDQIRYHRQVVRQLGKLESRLNWAARASLIAALAVAIVLGATAIRLGNLDAVAWKPLAIALLVALPATMTGLNGLRVNADLARLVERSGQSVATLFSIRRRAADAPQQFDQVAGAMQRFGDLLAAELADWRFVIESRRSRAMRRGISRKHRGLLDMLNPLRGKGNKKTDT